MERAREILDKEAQAILQLKSRVNSDFLRAIDLLLSCEGKVVVTGIGKSGLICQKIASTFASTGTPAFFLHPAEGVHGDLGVLTKKDVVLALSNSGETKEILNLLPVIQRMGLKLIGMTGYPRSPLGRASDVVLDMGVPEEACPLGLAPTSSTTAALALGDALAITLLERRGFTQEDFAALHPGGILGKRLLRVENLMHAGSEIPLIREGAPMKEVLLEMTGKRFGIIGVLDSAGELQGVVTDGDLRRALERYPNLLEKTVTDVMTRSPKRVDSKALAARALHYMEENKITCLFVVSESHQKVPVGVLHMHDLLKAGIS
ncbi:MAG: KpsF/GutQ family sugar-phosphate isomerase [Deltaproteobacteria bacterium]|nr:KpsF/GutQ family sugar-phosphate isomerase [Deltaproteobacteria bacterium]